MLPYMWVLLAHFGRARQMAKYDNELPRLQEMKCEGWVARAYAAHLNAFEALIVFAAAVFVAHLAGADPAAAGYAALTWLGVRVVHGTLYLANIDGLRTIVFFGGQGCVAWLFVLAARA